MTVVLPEQPIASTQNLQAKDLSLKSITVFNDRAEVKREFQVTLKAGLNEVRVENVATSIESESIRIDGRGPGTIHEVQFKEEPARQDEIDSDHVKQLVQKLKEFEDKKAGLGDRKETFSNRLKALDTLTTNFGKSNESATLKFDDSTETSLEKLFDYHEKKNIEIRAKIREYEKEIKHIDEDIQKTNNEINQLRASRHWKRSILLLLEAAEDGTKIDLELAYQVYNARWTPSYDVRVQTGDKADGVKLKISYFGNIQQDSGEDWKDVELILSTAQPRLGGMLPKLGTLNAQFYRPPPPPPERAMFENLSYARYDQERVVRSCMVPQLDMHEKLQHVEYTAEENVLSTTFTVPQRKTIPSDPSEHKVTIATMELDAILHYDVVPKKNTNAFLTAAVLNTSVYPLLTGQASIYLNNSFSTKTSIGPVYAGEKFDCPLGVDPSIKVQYKPVHKYQQQLGLLNKSSSTTNEQKIIVKNTKRDGVLLTIHEHIPKSTDEKIKIKLFTPEVKPGINHEEDNKSLKLPDVGAKLNNNHNLEWTILLSPDEERELSVKWTIDYPPTETIEYNEAF
uniref:Protein F37C4.5 n=1 Tax=Acrobeloides nanus TaxID=290746 RepID=A0A914ELR8_9BILA